MPQKSKENSKTKVNKASKTTKTNKAAKDPKTTTKRTKIITIILIIILVLAGVGAGIIFWLSTRQGENPEIDRAEFAEPVYSILTGEEISDAKLNSSPTFCIQVPNGSTDGARPQAGLSQAGVVFEAIAETGITRLAAIFQNPEVSAIGPIRSLRPYYLDWDTPFDCTVVHAGGSDEAISAIQFGGQRNLDEDYAYMWREDGSGRLWNNLFSSPKMLMEFNQANNYNTSAPKAFPRYTPEQNDEILAAKQCNPEDSDEPCTNENVAEIFVNFSNSASHNVRYLYDPETNAYLRFHQDGTPHFSYTCPTSLDQPDTKADCGDPTQIAPKAIAVMHVQESTMSDGYHENIKTIGSGDAQIFQNGDVIEGTWLKSTQDSQIVFRTQDDEEIFFAPGQLWIEAVPQFGSIDWQ